MSQPSRKPFAVVPEARAGQKIKAGGAGTVYHDVQRADMVLKILKPPHRTMEMEAKLHAMLSRPPMSQTFSYQQRTLVQIAWPHEIVVGARGEFVGFTMRLLDLSFANELFCWMDPGERRHLGFSQDDRLRVNLAANLATTLSYLHSVGHAFVDLKGLNVMAYKDLGYVCLIDCDGFRIVDNGRVFPADLYTENYLAPEYQAAARGRTLNKADVAEEQDRFALAVMIFELLDNATHPFSGRDLRNPNAASTIGDLIFQKRSFLDPASGLAAPATSHFTYFHDDTLLMLRRSLLGAPNQRPSAQDWRTHLKDLAKNLQPCSANPQHWGYGKGCPWCSSVAFPVPQGVAAPRQVPPPALAPPPAHVQRPTPAMHAAAVPAASPAPPSPKPAPPAAPPPSSGSAHASWPTSSVVTTGASPTPTVAQPSPRVPLTPRFTPRLWLPRVGQLRAATMLRPIAAMGSAINRRYYVPVAAIAAVVLLVAFWMSSGPVVSKPCSPPGDCESPPSPPSNLGKDVVAATERLKALTTTAGAYPPSGWDGPLKTAQDELGRILSGQQTDANARAGLARATRAIDQLALLWQGENTDRQAVASEMRQATDRLSAQVAQSPVPRPNEWMQTQSGAEQSLAAARSSLARGAKNEARESLSRAAADIDRLRALAERAALDNQRLDDDQNKPRPPELLPGPDPALAELSRRLGDLQIRAQVIGPRLDSLRERQRRLDLDLRGDMAAADLQMKQSLRTAADALNGARAQDAQQALAIAQTAIEKLERFLNI